MNFSGKNKLSFLSLLFIAVPLIAVYKIFDRIEDVMVIINYVVGISSPFVMAAVIAYLLYPICRKVSEVMRKSKYTFITKRANALAITVVYTFFLLLLSIIVMFLVPAIIDNVRDLIINIPRYSSSVYYRINEFIINNDLESAVDLTEYRSYITPENIGKVFNMSMVIVNGFIGITTTLFSFILSLIIAVYILIEKDRLLLSGKKVLRLFLPEEKVEVIGVYVRRTNEILYNFLIGKILDSLAVAVICTVVFYYMKVPYAPLMAFSVGFFNMIPYFGAVIGTAPVVVVTYLAGGFPEMIAAVVAVTIIQQIDNFLINPRILSKSVGLSPFWTMVALIIGGGLFGVWGMVLGVPFFAVLKMIFNIYYDRRQEKQKVKSEENPNVRSPNHRL